MRRRYVYKLNDAGEVEVSEVGSDWTDAPRSTGDLGKFQYDNLAATDGTDISSKTKHRAYMKANNLAMADDFKNTWSEAKAKRQAYRAGELDSKASAKLKDDLGRAWHKVQETKNGRRR